MTMDNDKDKEQKPITGDFRDVDPLRDAYRQSITHSPAVTRSLESHKTALLCIDMQYLDAPPVSACLQMSRPPESRSKRRNTISTG